MKKYVRSLILFIALILVVGCGKVVEDKEIVKVCKLTTNDIENGYKLESEYKIIAKNDVVDKVETIETVTSEDAELLTYFEEYLKDSYENYNKVYSGYTNKVENKDGKVISNTTIDYNVMDVEKYVKDNSVMKNYVNSDNKILLEGILSIYEELGAICE